MVPDQLQIQKGESLIYNVDATDPVGFGLTYALTVPVALQGQASIDPRLGRITWNTTANAALMTYTGFQVTVTDATGRSDSDTFSINVSADSVNPTVRLLVSDLAPAFGTPVTI